MNCGLIKLPNGELAQISMQKLAGYCLNPNHERGKDKARKFRTLLGITAEDAEQLYRLIQQAAIEGDVVQKTTAPFGQEFKLDWTIPDTAGIQLRTIWEIAPNSIAPRLITAFLK